VDYCVDWSSPNFQDIEIVFSPYVSIAQNLLSLRQIQMTTVGGSHPITGNAIIAKGKEVDKDIKIYYAKWRHLLNADGTMPSGKVQ
jgi:hypothetical protein